MSFRSVFRNQVTSVIVAGLLPGLVWWLLHFPLLCDMGTLDALYYFGYAHNFHELVDRYAFPYYSVRFGTILVTWLSIQIFGPSYGYAMLGCILNGACSIFLYLYLQRAFDKSTAWMGVVLWSINPAAIMLMIYPYCIAQALTIGFLGTLMCFWVVEAGRDQPRSWRLFNLEAGTGALAGLLFSAAGTGHHFVGVMLFFNMAGWICAYYRNYRVLITIAFFGLLGCCAGLGIASLVYKYMFNMPYILLPMMDIFRQLSTDASAVKQYLVPFDITFNTKFYIFAAPGLLAASGIIFVYCAYVRKLNSALLGSFVALAGMTGFYWGIDFFCNFYSLTCYYYFIIMVPGITLLLAALYGTLRQQPFNCKARLWQVAAAWAVFVFVCFGFSYLVNPTSGYVVLSVGGGLLLISCIAMCVAPGRWRLIGFTGVTGVSLGFPCITSAFRMQDFASSHNSIHYALMGVDLARIVPRVRDDWRPFYFVYALSGVPTLVQCSQVYHYSIFKAADYANLPLEAFPEHNLAIVRNRPMSRLYFLTTEENEQSKLKEAIKSISNAGIAFQQKDYHLQSGPIKMKVTELAFANEAERAKQPGATSEPVEYVWGFHESCPADRNNGIWYIKTSPKLQGWGGELIPKGGFKPGADLLVRMRVTRGYAAFALSKESTAPGPVQTGEHEQIRIPRTTDWVDVRFPSGWMGPGVHISLQNYGVSGLPSRLEIGAARWVTPSVSTPVQTTTDISDKH